MPFIYNKINEDIWRDKEKYPKNTTVCVQYILYSINIHYTVTATNICAKSVLAKAVFDCPIVLQSTAPMSMSNYTKTVLIQMDK